MIVGIVKVQIMVYNDLKIQHPTGLMTFFWKIKFYQSYCKKIRPNLKIDWKYIKYADII